MTCDYDNDHANGFDTSRLIENLNNVQIEK